MYLFLFYLFNDKRFLSVNSNYFKNNNNSIIIFFFFMNFKFVSVFLKENSVKLQQTMEVYGFNHTVLISSIMRESIVQFYYTPSLKFSLKM